MSNTHQVFEPLTVLTAQAALLRGANMDTDQIIPARFLKKDRAQGYGQYLFYDARFDQAQAVRTEHPLNAQPTPKIIVVEDNFGCGSSREGAVYALVDYGIRVVIGTTFGDIFHNNCFKNGVLPVKLQAADHQRLLEHMQQGGAAITVDLVQQTLDWQKGQASFEIDAFWKKCLTQGLDELSLTLTHQADIEQFEKRYEAAYPWLVPSSPAREA
jgi:3-isopropylmalate/(R)-2-methylmalate dehydratase small subunit